jgi:tripartite-type tricarboxylate transporter receptor subunit TctC
VGGTPQQLAAVLKAEMERVGKLIREAGIREN